MKSLPNLLWLRSFESASRLGSFTAAGTDLGLTQAAVSSHISALEAQLGHVLFKRTTRRMELTESGRAYLPSVRKALQDLTRSTESLFGKPSAGSVTLRAPISAAVLVVAPALSRFQKENPNLSIRLLSSIWADTVMDSGIDIEMRLGTGNWPDCEAEQLGPEFVVPVCHPELAPAITAPEDLLDHDSIQILGFDGHWPQLFEATQVAGPGRTGMVTVDTSLAAVEWAAARGGVALILERAARRLAATGRLAIPLEVRIPLGQSHYLIHRNETQIRSSAVERVENWLRSLFADQD